MNLCVLRAEISVISTHFRTLPRKEKPSCAIAAVICGLRKTMEARRKKHEPDLLNVSMVAWRQLRDTARQTEGLYHAVRRMFFLGKQSTAESI